MNIVNIIYPNDNQLQLNTFAQQIRSDLQQHNCHLLYKLDIQNSNIDAFPCNSCKDSDLQYIQKGRLQTPSEQEHSKHLSIFHPRQSIYTPNPWSEYFHIKTQKGHHCILLCLINNRKLVCTSLNPHPISKAKPYIYNNNDSLLADCIQTQEYNHKNQVVHLSTNKDQYHNCPALYLHSLNYKWRGSRIYPNSFLNLHQSLKHNPYKQPQASCSFSSENVHVTSCSLFPSNIMGQHSASTY
ncbi:unnamed protein product [Paramecium octaurelia]|uniref:Uncharacterized protein n=1 Tax=Paramecium octaurelia TaxID=43137 RepID=A0A8S1SBF9_PAROT|nr:unnamed protein product [Paramecium octaurelia]